MPFPNDDISKNDNISTIGMQILFRRFIEWYLHIAPIVITAILFSCYSGQI